MIGVNKHVVSVLTSIWSLGNPVLDWSILLTSSMLVEEYANRGTSVPLDIWGEKEGEREGGREEGREGGRKRGREEGRKR